MRQACATLVQDVCQSLMLINVFKCMHSHKLEESPNLIRNYALSLLSDLKC